jgi:hypothetical protein
MRSLRILAVLIVLGGAGPALAEDAPPPPSPESLQAATELFAVLSTDMVNQLMGQMTAAFWPVIEQKARADKIDDGTITEMRKAFERIQTNFVTNALKEAPAIYARHFTVAELHELTAFYRTPTGDKALHEMPRVMGEFTSQLVPRMQDVQHEIGEAFSKILREHGYVKYAGATANLSRRISHG